MDVATTRHVNFLYLLKKFRDEHSELPLRGILKMFAAHVGSSDKFFSHLKTNRKPIGAAVARQIETALSLPHGWMDVEHTDLEPRDFGERTFMESMITLYRTSPAAAQGAMVELLKTRLNAR